MKLFITSRIPESTLERLEEHFEVFYNDSLTPLSKEELIEGVQDVDAILCPLSDKIDREIIESANNLKMIANFGAGFDNIDLKAATENSVVVTNAPAKSSAVSTAEFSFGLMIALARNIVQGDALMRRREFLAWRPTFYLGTQLAGKTLGIIGLGNIGMNMAKRALAFEMDVIYYSRNKKKEAEELGIRYVEMDELLEKSDFISLHTALTEDLIHLISTEEFKKMKTSAMLINASRGPVVDEKALIEALKYGEIAGAALDVYEFEPEFSEELLSFENVILAPHLGNATFEARYEMGDAASENLIAFKEGREPKNRVN